MVDSGFGYLTYGLHASPDRFILNLHPLAADGNSSALCPSGQTPKP